MNDMELAEEIEEAAEHGDRGYARVWFTANGDLQIRCRNSEEIQAIIAALRRVPIAKHCLAGDGGCTFHKCDCPTQEGYSPTDRQATQNLTRPPSGEMVLWAWGPNGMVRAGDGSCGYIWYAAAEAEGRKG